MIPGELLPTDGEVRFNENRQTATVTVANTGDEREVGLVAIGGRRIIRGLNGLTQGALDDPEIREVALQRAGERGFM